MEFMDIIGIGLVVLLLCINAMVKVPYNWKLSPDPEVARKKRFMVEVERLHRMRAGELPQRGTLVEVNGVYRVHQSTDIRV